RVINYNNNNNNITHLHFSNVCLNFCFLISFDLLDLTSYDLKSLDLQTKPISLHKLEMMTNFTRKELQLLYQGFKHICPSGVASKESFIGVYRRFFPNR
ncbi:uncharacterized protein DC041_0000721, partial [Schistosoma bovis]